MSTSGIDQGKLLSALDTLLGKYFKEKDQSPKGQKPKDVFWETYLGAARDEDSARPADWDGNTGSTLTFTGLFATTIAAFVIES